MTHKSILFQKMTFSYDRANRPLFHDLSVHLTRGWTGVVGANGVGKSTLLKLATGKLEPQQGDVRIPEFAIYCQQRTDTVPRHLDALIQAMDGTAFGIKGRLGVGEDWCRRWHTLSHGERKRAQIAVALWRQPEVLAVDEPTNHLDTEALAVIVAALSSFQGVGLLVSHDRELLDDLCQKCLFVDPPEAVLRPGGYTEGLRQAEAERSSAAKQRSQAKQALSRLKGEAKKRRASASQAHRKRSKRGLGSKDHDARAKIDLARLSGKDGSAGRLLNQLGGRLTQAQEKLDGIKVKKTYAMGIWMPGSQSRRDTLIHLPSGSLRLGADRRLRYPDLCMQPTDRIALTGPNGSGKSSLIRHLMRSLNLESEQVTYLPQEIDATASQEIMAEARALPHAALGRMMTIVSRLGSRPERLLESALPSPGEIRKVLLATGIARAPQLIVMDEPTNHLDLPSIECLEQALVGCPCGLLLVSHDRRFLSALSHKRWHISAERSARGDLVLEVR